MVTKSFASSNRTMSSGVVTNDRVVMKPSVKKIATWEVLMILFSVQVIIRW